MPVRCEVNVLALIKGDEQYVFIYDDDSRSLLIDAFRDAAADPRFSFTWFDAAVLTEKAREQASRGRAALPATRSTRLLEDRLSDCNDE
jgi:hypothetical protein